MRYFAYGSNLRTTQLLQRCPSATFVSNATLKGWRLTFTGWSGYWKGAVATIVRDRSSSVPGAVYDIRDPKDVRSLDMAEGCPAIYACQRMMVVPAQGQRLRVWTYVKTDPRPGSPSKEYALAIAAGLREHKLPMDHLAQSLFAAGYNEVTIRKKQVKPEAHTPVWRVHTDERPRPPRGETRPRFAPRDEEDPLGPFQPYAQHTLPPVQW
jgi:hypothetical protein